MRVRIEINGHQYYSTQSGTVLGHGQTVELFDGKPMQVPCITLETGATVLVIPLAQQGKQIHVYKED